jgi:TrmH family RNA methyltransferase
VVEATLADISGLDAALVATVVGAPLRYTDADLRAPSAIAVGAEDAGLADPWLRAADLQVAIPVLGRSADSLNASAAAAVVLYEAVRQRG